MNKLLMGTLAFVVTVTSTSAFADKEVVGQIVGGIIGGVIGNQVGGGNGKKVATGVGIIAGAIIGGQIGQRLDEADRMELERAQNQALRSHRLHETYRWNAGPRSRTRAYGDFTCTRSGRHYRTGYVCREYYSVVYYRGNREQTRGVVCQDRYNRWYETYEREVSWDGGPARRRGPTRVYSNLQYEAGGFETVHDGYRGY